MCMKIVFKFHSMLVPRARNQVQSCACFRLGTTNASRPSVVNVGERDANDLFASPFYIVTGGPNFFSSCDWGYHDWRVSRKKFRLNKNHTICFPWGLNLARLKFEIQRVLFLLVAKIFTFTILPNAFGSIERDWFSVYGYVFVLVPRLDLPCLYVTFKYLECNVNISVEYNNMRHSIFCLDNSCVGKWMQQSVVA